MKKSFLMFLFIGIIIFTVAADLFLNFKKAQKNIYKAAIGEVIKESCNFAKNYKNELLSILPKNKDWYEFFKTHPKIRKKLQHSLSLMNTPNIKYIYLLGIKHDKFVFLIDASKKDRAEFGEIFEPLNKKEFFILKPHYFFHKKLKNIFLTYLYPIVVNNKLKAVFVIDYSLNLSNFIKNILNRLTKNTYFVLAIAIILFLVLLFISYIDYKREKEKEKLLQKIQKINKELEERIKKEVKKIREKDTIILNQSKLASLGEMLNMIAHQWRQPLNSLSTYAITAEIKSEMNEFDETECKKFAQFVQKQSQKMSETIDDFMNFSKPDQKKEEFFIKDVIIETLNLINIQLKNHNINLQYDIDENLKIKSFKKELSHILLNLISNARDALDNIKDKEKTIKIYTQTDKEYIKIIIEDNAGGISEDIKNRIFEPYFTTKSKNKGTGIGLYMSKKIAQEKLNGDISFENTKEGVKFILKIKR